MKVVYEKDRNSRPNYLNKTDELLGYDLGSQLIAVLERELSEPLDDIDADEVTKQRLREVW